MVAAMKQELDERTCDIRFRDYLEGYAEQLAGSSVVCAYGLWSDLNLAYLSPGWFAFAKANGGDPSVTEVWRLGRNLLEAIQGPLRAGFERNYERSLRENRPWSHCYECSSAERYRWFHMMAYPLPKAAGLMVIQSLRVERLRAEQSSGAVARPEIYVSEADLITQCSYCRRVRRANRPEVWDLVRQWIIQPPTNTSHGICPACYGHYMRLIETGEEQHLPFETSTAD